MLSEVDAQCFSHDSIGHRRAHKHFRAHGAHKKPSAHSNQKTFLLLRHCKFFVAANIANLLRNYDVGARAGTVDLLHGSTGTRRALPVAMSGA